MLVSWNWLKDYLGDTPLTAAEAAEKLGMHAFELEGVEQVGEDTVIDVDILPNRSSDCLCHRGIARELASITGTPLAHDPLATVPALSPLESVAIDIVDSGACPRFSASLVTGIKVKDSPQWLQDRLQAIGQRPINNIVDATNYVMFALGQPIHAYDAELFPQVEGGWQFTVRFAEPGETVSLIPEGGKTEERIVECTGTELLIVDGSSNTPIGLAGVKGGSFAGVHEGTTQVIIEAAHFHPTITRKTARRLGIVIDASKRFENEPSRELIPYTQAAVTKLITDIAGGTYEGTIDIALEEKANPAVEISPKQVNTLLGLQLDTGEMVELLARTGSDVALAGETITATGPWERTDLNIAEDFIEEIGRLHGYSNITAVSPTEGSAAELNKRHFYSEQVRHALLAVGCSEVITSSFRKNDEVQLKNALASDKSYLRSNLIKNLTEALDKNASFTDLLGTNDTRLFEIGTVFHKSETGVGEHVALAIGVRIKPSGYTGKEDKQLAALTEAVETVLNSPIDWTTEKGVAECNLTELLAKLPDPTEYEEITVAEEVVYQPFSSYPHMSRDIALWVSDSPGESLTKDVEQVLNEAAGELRVRTTQFDEFTKDGRTSLAFRLVFQSHEKTLTDEAVNAVMEAVYAAATKEGWEVR
jgi:phenylalanyl-tRNA synthetase beta chain